MKLTFLPAIPEDADLLFQLNKDLIDRYEDCAAIPYDRVLSWVRENLIRQIPQFRRVMSEGRLAGFYCLSPAEDQWELDSLFVFPEFQNRGIGTEILKHCIEESGGNLFLYVFRNNTGATALYKRLGFRAAREVGTTRYIMEYEKQGC